MRVLYITNIPAPYKVEFLNRLSQKCDLTVAFERNCASDRDERWKTVENWEFNTLQLKSINVDTDSSLSFDLIRHIARVKYDVIVFGVYHTLTAMITMQYMNLNHIPFIMSSDGGFIKTEGRVKYLIKHHFISMADWYLSPGGKTDEYLIHYGANINKISRYSFTSVSECDLVDIDKHTELRQEAKKKLGYGNASRKMILMVGQMIPRKGVDILLEALDGISDKLDTVIVGGNPPDEYKKIVIEKELQNVHFLDFMSKRELAKYYLAADVFVLPTREDIWGLVIIEAMSYGVPIVTTDCCNAGIEISKAHLAEIVPTDDAEKLRKSILDSLDWTIPSIWSEMARRFTYENEVEEHMQTFERFMQNVST